MKYDGGFNLATGMSARSKVWKNEKYTWSKLVKRLTTENKTNETLKEYQASSREEQSKIKDVGGYVGAYLRQGKRSPHNVVTKQILTLDIDYAHLNFWDDFCMLFGNAAVLHATHSFSEKSPRYRLIMPVSRECTSDEYVAIARKIAGDLGIDLFDNTTFETNRLMFWPSNPKDVEYYVEFQDGEWIDVDEVLGSYMDWTDTSLWPTADRKLQEVRNLTDKQEDPQFKKGLIGAFCRTYTITDAIENILFDEYKPSTDGRYTYTKGSAAGGLITYDDKFAYSHHGTDPVGGKLCNAYDLVRIHKFGHLDTSSTARKLPSMDAMDQYCINDDKTKITIAREKFQEVTYDFAEDYVDEEADPFEKISPEDVEWAKELEIDGRGRFLSSAKNINLILKMDSHLKGLFRENKFDNKRYLTRSAPWRVIKEPEAFRNVDYSGVRNYIETIYGVVGVTKIEDAVALEFERNSFHPIKEYLSDLEWDQQPRIDRFLIDYYGAEDSEYTKQAIAKTLIGAVARIFVPGTKFDLVLTLVGDQGTGKSTLVHKLGNGWSSDTFLTVHGKDAFEQLQGAWLIEMAELSGLRKAEVETVKHFISKQVDTFRPAYGRTSEVYPRQCVFIGTTNNSDFLTDPTGNRRFVPVAVNRDKTVKSIFSINQQTIDQIWAEAVYRYRAGEKIYFDAEVTDMAKKEQEKHSVIDDRTGVVVEFLDTLIPENWDELDILMRKDYLDSPDKDGIERDYVCVAEIWCECFGNMKKDMDRYKTRDINEIMKSLQNWERINSTKNFKHYGKQKYYQRRLD